MDAFEAERQRALDNLTSAYALDKITLEEYEERADRIQKALSIDGITSQIADLPVPAIDTSNPLNTSRASSRGTAPLSSRRDRTADSLSQQGTYLVEQRQGSPEFLPCIMGDRKMVGDWLNSDSATSITLMGSTTLDLTETAIPPGRLKIEAIAIMGEIKILVPRGLPVRMSAFPFMGEAHIQKGVEQRVDRNLPYVEISGLALMGSIVVKSV